MPNLHKTSLASILLTGCILGVASGAAFAHSLEGKVQGGGLPIANSTVTLWAAAPTVQNSPWGKGRPPLEAVGRLDPRRSSRKEPFVDDREGRLGP